MLKPPLPTIVITAGEPAGIGLDLCVTLANKMFPAEIVVITDQDALTERAKCLQTSLICSNYVPHHTAIQHLGNGELQVCHMPTSEAVIAGKLNPKNGPYVLQTLERAIDGCMEQEFDAMVTAPVHKGIINDANIAFTGHTEFIADHTETKEVVMMLVGGGMRVALASRHVPLKDVPSVITKSGIEKTIRILHADMVKKFGITDPVIYVAGLNPHAGEGGYLGDEELTTINPVLDKLRSEGMKLVGALPADTMFSQKNIQLADAFLAMYHDQGLAVLKHASFGGGINITLGLPIIRTSVDHGTALELAGTGKAEAGSLFAAIDLAISLANASIKHSMTSI